MEGLSEEVEICGDCSAMSGPFQKKRLARVNSHHKETDEPFPPENKNQSEKISPNKSGVEGRWGHAGRSGIMRGGGGAGSQRARFHCAIVVITGAHRRVRCLHRFSPPSPNRRRLPPLLLLLRPLLLLILLLLLLLLRRCPPPCSHTPPPPLPPVTI